MMKDPARKVFGGKVLGAAFGIDDAVLIAFLAQVIKWMLISKTVHVVANFVSPSLIPLLQDAVKNASGNIRAAAESVASRMTESQITDLAPKVAAWQGTAPVQNQSRTAFGTNGGIDAISLNQYMITQQLANYDAPEIPAEAVRTRNDLTLALNDMPPEDKCAWIQAQLRRAYEANSIDASSAGEFLFRAGEGVGIPFLSGIHNSSFVIDSLRGAARMLGCPDEGDMRMTGG